MMRAIFAILLAFEIFALANRGGAPLLSYLILTGAIFVVVCLAIFFRRKLKLSVNVPIILYVLFFACFLLSIVFALTPQYGFSELLLYADAGILFFIISNSEIDEKSLKYFSVALISLAVVDTLIGYFIYTKTAFPRFTGTFIDLAEPYVSTGNDFANFLLLILPLSLAHFFKKHERVITTILSGLAFSILFSGFLLSFSRGAWLSFFAAAILLAVWIFIQRKKNHEYVGVKKIVLRIAATIVLVVLLTGGLQFVRSQQFETLSLTKKLLFQADEGAASASERMEYWQAAAQIIKDRPILGGGVMSFKYLFPQYQKTFGINTEYPHSFFFRIGVENGIFALAFLIAFLVAAAGAILKFLRKNPWHLVLPFSFGGLMAIGHHLIDVNFTSLTFAFFALFIAIGFSFANRKKNIQKTARFGQVWLYSILVGSIILLVLGAHEAFYNIDFKKGRTELADGKLNEAIIHLERAQKLIFPRDAANYLVDAYEDQYKKTADKKWREKEKDLLLKNINYPFFGDAAMVSRLVEITCEEQHCKDMGKMASFALQLDSQNRLKYYYQAFIVAQKTGRLPPFGLKTKVKEILAQYVEILKENRHLTVLTDNPQYAPKLYEIFNMPKEKEKLDKIWFEELVKFTTKYGALKQQVL